MYRSVGVAMENEVWKRIEGWPYEASSLGRIRNLDGYVLSCCSMTSGTSSQGSRRMTQLSNHGVFKSFPVATLVCSAFNGPRPSSELYAAHKNGLDWDDRPSNLYWATPKENALDALYHKQYGNKARPRTWTGGAQPGSGRPRKVKP